MDGLKELENLTGDITLADAFHDCYVKLLAEAWVANDRERIKALRVILHREVAFVAMEMVKAKREEDGREEIVQ